MLNTKKRTEWRAKKEILKQWSKEQELMDAMKEEIADLRLEVQKQKDETFLYEKNNAILGDLFEKRIIDKDGNLL